LAFSAPRVDVHPGDGAGAPVGSLDYGINDIAHHRGDIDTDAVTFKKGMTGRFGTGSELSVLTRIFSPSAGTVFLYAMKTSW
jgi:hypothetical protein